jgi:hypothetical protein
MIILPDKNLPVYKILPFVKNSDWRDPSQRLYTYDIPNKTIFVLKAKTHDGVVVWKGNFSR